jgi:hypothetical protein
MALKLYDPSLDERQLGHLMPLHGAGSQHLLDQRGQTMPAMLALLRQHGPNFVDSFGRRQRPMRSTMAGLATHFPPTLLLSAALSCFAR